MPPSISGLICLRLTYFACALKIKNWTRPSLVASMRAPGGVPAASSFRASFPICRQVAA
jgi:hypothetical protein